MEDGARHAFEDRGDRPPGQVRLRRQLADQIVADLRLDALPEFLRLVVVDEEAVLGEQILVVERSLLLRLFDGVGEALHREAV